MAKADNGLFLVPRQGEPPKIPTHNIAVEALSIACECVEALQRYHAETEIRLGGIADLLDSLELAAIRAIRKGNVR